MASKKRLGLIIVLMVGLFVLSVGVTYAYFEAQVNQSGTSGVTITAVEGLSITFDTQNVITMNNIIPGESDEKEITVTLDNKGKEFDVTYNMKIHVTESTFDEEHGKLTYTLTGDGITNSLEGEIPYGLNQDITILRNKVISGEEGSNTPTEQTYNLVITYPNDEENVQEQGATFDGYVYFTGREEQTNIKINYKSINNYTNDDLIIGDMLVIPREGGEERFYYIGADINNTTKKAFLAEWNIDVGADTINGIEYSTDYMNSPASGFQSNQVVGYKPGFTTKGTIAFSTNDIHPTDEACANEGVGMDPGIYSTPAGCYTAYKGSILEHYTNKYLNAVKEVYTNNNIVDQIIDTIESRAIDYDELVRLGCVYNEEWDNGTCEESPYSWLYQTSFWTAASNDPATAWKTDTEGRLGGAFFRGNDYAGVRPVFYI